MPSQATAYRRRRLYTLPIEPIIDHPRYIALPAAGAGILWRLIVHFWQTDCAPLPTQDDQLVAIARAHKPTWCAWKEDVLLIFNDVAPALSSSMSARITGASHLRIVAWRAGGVHASRAATKRLPKPPSAFDSPDNVTPMLPRTDPDQARPKIPTVENRPTRPRRTDGR